ncbi:MAG: hypothetical protein II875_08370 [Clostridia bacterium]|nr:hypothetical protein [Clostridia bacterium]
MKKLLWLTGAIVLLLSFGFSALAYDYWDMRYPSCEVNAPKGSTSIYLYPEASASASPVASYRNGDILRIIDYGEDTAYFFVIGPDGNTGYVKKDCVIPLDGSLSANAALDEYEVVSDQRIVYLFARASESGEPVASYAKGDRLWMLDYDGDKNFAYVTDAEGNRGYIRKNHLMKVYDYDAENYDCYRVTSTYSSGYLYMYPAPSTGGTPLARYDNGTVLKVIDYYVSDTFCLAVGPDGRAGYVSKSQLTQEAGTGDLGPVFEVFSTRSYCYMYAKPSSGSTNLGKYVNGDEIEIIDWGAHEKYAFVRGVKDDRYGYIQKVSLHPSSVSPVKGYMKVKNTSASFVYLYEKASDGSKNLGRYENDEQVGILDWLASEKYALVMTNDGKIGFIKKNCLASLFS